MNVTSYNLDDPLFATLVPAPFSFPSPRAIADKNGFEALSANCIFVVVDHGFDKGRVLHHIVDATRKGGYAVFYFDCSLYEATECASQLVRFLRDAGARAKRGLLVAVGIANLPDADEKTQRRQCKAIERALEAGCKVCVTTLPSTDSITNYFPDSFVIDHADLMATGHDEDHRITLLTRRIPSLVSALLDDAGRTNGSVQIPAAYFSELRALCRAELEDMTADASARIRLAAMMLGSGSFDDLLRLLPDVSEREIVAVETQAPFFGVSLGRREFCVAGLCFNSVFQDCAPILKNQAAQHSALVTSVAQFLMDGNNISRAMTACGLCDNNGDVADLVVRNATKLICAGKMRQVQRALALFEEAGYEVSPSFSIAKATLAELSLKGKELVAARRAVRKLHHLTRSEAAMVRHAGLMGVMRNILQNVQGELLGLSEPDDDRTARELVTCCSALSLLTMGEFSRCFDLLIDSPHRIEPDTLTGALLCMMYDVARAMTGEVQTQSERQDLERAQRLIEGSGIKRLVDYGRYVGEVLGVLVGEEVRFFSAEKAITSADAYGDVAMGAAFRIVAAISDVRAGAIVRARVRLGEARKMMGERYSYLGMLATTIGLAVRAMDGETLGEKDIERDFGPLADLQRVILCSAKNGTSSGLKLATLSRAMCHADYSWLVMFLTGDCHAMSTQVRRVVPSSWLRIVEAKWPGRSRLMRAGADEDAGNELGKYEDFRATGFPIELSILGGTRVWVKGHLVGPATMGRRKAIMVLKALAVAKGHTMRRRDLVCSLWPDSDYARGAKRLYEATSVLRTALGFRRDGKGIENPVVVNKAEGTVSLNMDVIACDLDEFEREASIVLRLEGKGAASSMHAIAVERLYNTGFDACAGDFPDTFRSREDGLHRLFVDAMVAGATSALSEGKPVLASQLARRARDEDDVREDAMIVLVEALKTLGRPREIEREYESYLRAVRRMGVPGSQAVAQAVKDALDEIGQ